MKNQRSESGGGEIDVQTPELSVLHNKLKTLEFKVDTIEKKRHTGIKKVLNILHHDFPLDKDKDKAKAKDPDDLKLTKKRRDKTLKKDKEKEKTKKSEELGIKGFKKAKKPSPVRRSPIKKNKK